MMQSKISEAMMGSGAVDIVMVEEMSDILYGLKR